MQSPWMVSLGVAVGLIVGVSVPRPQIPPLNTAEPVDAAFRDGKFQATFDVQSGRKPHLACGRWNKDEDRALYIAGYEQGYRETLQGQTEKLLKAEVDEVAGYQDGLLDGAAHHATSHSFQPEKTARFLAVGQGPSEERRAAVKNQRSYREAYVNGYQQGYYSQNKSKHLSYYAQEKD
jgi:hypothetical protein